MKITFNGLRRDTFEKYKEHDTSVEFTFNYLVPDLLLFVAGLSIGFAGLLAIF